MISRLIKLATTLDCSTIYHMGDHQGDKSLILKSFPQATIVNGNGDQDERSLYISTIVERVKILTTHGHLDGVKFGRENLIEIALEKNFQAVFYGHTHFQRDEFRDGVWLINPGAAFRGEYAIVTIDGENISTELAYISET